MICMVTENILILKQKHLNKQFSRLLIVFILCNNKLLVVILYLQTHEVDGWMTRDSRHLEREKNKRAIYTIEYVIVRGV
jgi:hypothetical protein